MCGFYSDSALKLTLLFICIALHFFIITSLFYSLPLPEKLYLLNTEKIDFHEINARVSFFSLIAGGYCLGKMADRHGFINTMKIICLMYILTTILLIFFDGSSTFKSDVFLCLVHGLLSFLGGSSFILPVIYIFQHYKKSDRPMHSALAWITALFGIMVANLSVSIFKKAQHIDWCMVSAVSGILSVMLYTHIASLPELKIKQTPAESISKEAIFLAFLLVGVCGIGITYQYYFIEHYVRDVMILKTPGQQLIYSPFWITLFLTLLPAAKITKNLKTVKTIQQSLLGMLLSVSLIYIFPFFNQFIIFVHQVIFAISFGLFLSPALRFIYRLLKGYNSYFYMNFIFCLGFCFFRLVAAYLAGLKFLSVPLQGASLIALMMSACLWIDRHYRLSSTNI